MVLETKGWKQNDLTIIPNDSLGTFSFSSPQFWALQGWKTLKETTLGIPLLQGTQEGPIELQTLTTLSILCTPLTRDWQAIGHLAGN